MKNLLFWGIGIYTLIGCGVDFNINKDDSVSIDIAKPKAFIPNLVDNTKQIIGLIPGL